MDSKRLTGDCCADEVCGETSLVLLRCQIARQHAVEIDIDVSLVPVQSPIVGNNKRGRRLE